MRSKVSFIDRSPNPESLKRVLDEAANRSFYEDFTIGWDDSAGEYFLEDDFSTFGDEAIWTYDGGLDVPHAEGSSGLMDPSEFFDNYRQIEHYMPEAIDALLAGDQLGFAYMPVNDGDLIFDEETQSYVDEDGDFMDELAGWTLGWTNYGPSSRIGSRRNASRRRGSRQRFIPRSRNIQASRRRVARKPQSAGSRNIQRDRERLDRIARSRTARRPISQRGVARRAGSTVSRDLRHRQARRGGRGIPRNVVASPARGRRRVVAYDGFDIEEEVYFALDELARLISQGEVEASLIWNDQVLDVSRTSYGRGVDAYLEGNSINTNAVNYSDLLDFEFFPRNADDIIAIVPGAAEQLLQGENVMFEYGAVADPSFEYDGYAFVNPETGWDQQDPYVGWILTWEVI